MPTEQLRRTFKALRTAVHRHKIVVAGAPTTGILLEDCLQIAFTPHADADTGENTLELDPEDLELEAGQEPAPGIYVARFLDPETKEEISCIEAVHGLPIGEHRSPSDNISRERANSIALNNIAAELQREHARSMDLERRLDETKAELCDAFEIINEQRATIADLEGELAAEGQENEQVNAILGEVIPFGMEWIAKQRANNQANGAELAVVAPKTAEGGS